MNKNIFYAITFSILIITISFYVQNRFFPSSAPIELSQQEIKEQTEDKTFVKTVVKTNTEQNAATPSSVQRIEQEIKISTNIFSVVFSNKNAIIKSLSRKSNINGENIRVELIPELDKTNEALGKSLGKSLGKYEAFRVFFADERENNVVNDVLYDVSKPDSKTVVFSRMFETKEGQQFTFEKRFIFEDNEDVFEIKIKIKNNKNEELLLGNTAYTLSFGPQLGPTGEVLSAVKQSKRISRRWFTTLLGKKLKNINNVKAGRSLIRDKPYKWSGISGRYFSLLVLTSSVQYKTQFSADPIEGFATGAQITFLRPSIQSSAIADTFRIYIGPSSGTQLARYNKAEDNSFGISDANFNKVKPQRLLTFLERPFGWLLNMFYRVFPNYGIAIILLTILVRLVTYPVMRKGKVNGEKMKMMAPKTEAIKKRFPDDSARQSKEIMELYRREKFSPFSSFFPMLIQFPFFIAMYRVIYENFSLWRQPFFGWITDLSQPDILISFGNYTIPFINWNALHLFPIIMIGTQFFSSLIMMKQQQQTSPAGGKGMMMFLSYGFPFIIFFALYNSPSGLILYWIISNLFTILTMFDKPKAKSTNEIVSHAKAQEKNRRAHTVRAKTKNQKKGKKSFLERMQNYVDENTKQNMHRKK